MTKKELKQRIAELEDRVDELELENKVLRNGVEMAQMVCKALRTPTSPYPPVGGPGQEWWEWHEGYAIPLWQLPYSTGAAKGWPW